MNHLHQNKEREADLRPRLPSTWRDPIGKPLTDRLITKYAKQGRYGEEARQRALHPPSKSKRQPVDISEFV